MYFAKSSRVKVVRLKYNNVIPLRHYLHRTVLIYHTTTTSLLLLSRSRLWQHRRNITLYTRNSESRKYFNSIPLNIPKKYFLVINSKINLPVLLRSRDVIHKQKKSLGLRLTLVECTRVLIFRNMVRFPDRSHNFKESCEF